MSSYFCRTEMGGYARQTFTVIAFLAWPRNVTASIEIIETAEVDDFQRIVFVPSSRSLMLVTKMGNPTKNSQNCVSYVKLFQFFILCNNSEVTPMKKLNRLRMKHCQLQDAH